MDRLILQVSFFVGALRVKVKKDDSLDCRSEYYPMNSRRCYNVYPTLSKRHGDGDVGCRLVSKYAYTVTLWVIPSGMTILE